MSGRGTSRICTSLDRRVTNSDGQATIQENDATNNNDDQPPPSRAELLEFIEDMRKNWAAEDKERERREEELKNLIVELHNRIPIVDRRMRLCDQKKVGSVRIAATRKAPTVDVEIFDGRGKYLASITAVPDSGAEATVAGFDVLKLLDGDVENLLHRGVDDLVAANGLSLETSGRLNYKISLRGVSTLASIIFCPQHTGLSLSWFVCVELGLLPANYPEPVTAPSIQSTTLLEKPEQVQPFRPMKMDNHAALSYSPAEVSEPCGTTDDSPPSRVFEDVLVEIFSLAGNHYFIYADRLSGWPAVHVVFNRDYSDRDVTQFLTRNFVDLGVPTWIRSDDGRLFASVEIHAFLNKWATHYAISDPSHAPPNSYAGAAVEAMKSLITKTVATGRFDTKTFQRGLLEWRNTPKFDGLSPAEIVLGHPIRSNTPANRAIFAHHSKFAEKWRDIMDCRDRAQYEQMERVEEHANPIPPIPTNTAVRVQNPMSKRWDRCGIVISIGYRRDYRVKMQSGRVYWLKRRFLCIEHAKPSSGDAPPLPVFEAHDDSARETFIPPLATSRNHKK